MSSTWLSRLKQVRDGLGGNRIILIAAVAVVVLAAVIFVVLAASGPSFVVLYRNLDPGDASSIIEYLNEQKTPYSLADGGTTILVPAREADITRIGLAGKGLPRGGTVGYEVMDSLSIGATDFERRVNYVRALQGELARTIQHIHGVQSARVHIVLPENSLFIQKARPATASVFVKLSPLTKLDRDQVSGIMYLVAHAVEGLSPENVSVIDVNGRILSHGIADASAAGTAAGHNDLTRAFQTELQQGIEHLLERVFGPGNVAVQVSATLDFDQKVIERTFFEPGTGDGLVRSVQELEETFRGEGLPLEQSGNIPVYQSPSERQSSDYARRETTRNLELNQISEKVVVAPGKVTRLSVAVLINRDLSPEESRLVEQTVAAAIGSDASREDQITVYGMKFDTSLQEAILKDMNAPVPVAPWWQKVLIPSLAVFFALVVLSVLVMMLLRGKRQAKLEPVPVAVKEVAATSDDISGPRPIREIERLVQKNPEGVAQIIKAWMNGD